MPKRSDASVLRFRASAALDAQLRRYRDAEAAWRASPLYSPSLSARQAFVARWVERGPAVEWPERKDKRREWKRPKKSAP